MTRRSLRSDATITGVGLFTGADCTVRLAPAEPGRGIVFVRAGTRIPARIDAIAHQPVHPALADQAPPNTTLRAGNTTVATVEHLLSALAGLGVTDATVELDGPEVPIGDGSARAFVDAIREAQVCDLDANIQPVVVRDEIIVRDGDAWIRARAAEHGTSYAYELDYGPGSPIEAQSAAWAGDADEYAQNIAPARTFSFRDEAQAMRSLGLFSRFTPEDLLVIGADGPIDNAWRFDNEPARHKLLDLIGDLALVGAPIIAQITAHKSGHALNHEMARRLAALTR